MPTDITPPQLVALNMPIRSITVTDSGYSGNNLGVSLAASDDVSGIASYSIYWTGPNNKQLLVQTYQLSGNVLNGVFSQKTNAPSYSPFLLDKYSPSGTYTLSQITINDEAGNSKSYSTAAALTAAGLNINDYSLNVTGSALADITPPQLVALNMPIRSITVTDSGYSGNNLGVSLAASDDVSGIASYSIYWTGPNNKQLLVQTYQLSGNVLNGVFSQKTNAPSYSPFLLDKYSPSGTYTLSQITINDEAGNSKSYSTAAALTAAGLNINDYSLNVLNTVPTYSISASSGSINEGATVNFTLTTTNVASGTSIPFTLTGVSSSDVSGGLLSGNAVVNSSGIATISVTLINDALTEGAETLTLSAGDASASAIVNDTSRTPLYSLARSSASVDEGSSVTFTLTTSNLATGTSVPYTLSGVSSSDVSGGLLSGNAVVNSSGLATILVTLVNDVLSEGAEALTVTAGGASASTTVNDTSISGPVFKIIPTGINYTVSPISLSGTLQGTSTVTPAFFHYLADSTKENVSILKAGTYSFEVVRDSRWGYDGS